MINKLLTVSEIAGLMGINTGKAYKLVQNGHMKTLKLGKRGLKIPASEYNKFIEENIGNDISELFN